MSADIEALLATVRAGIAHRGGDAAHAALDSIAAELERVKQKRDEWKRSYAEEVGRLDTALERVRAERDAWKAQMLRADQDDLVTEARLDKALAALRDVDAAFRWVAENYPKAIREMPRELYQPLRRIAEIEGEE